VQLAEVRYGGHLLAAGARVPTGGQRPRPVRSALEAGARLPPPRQASPSHFPTARAGNLACAAPIGWPDGLARRRRALDNSEENPHSAANPAVSVRALIRAGGDRGGRFT
jgi:hypothetical protein